MVVGLDWRGCVVGEIGCCVCYLSFIIFVGVITLFVVGLFGGWGGLFGLVLFGVGFVVWGVRLDLGLFWVFVCLGLYVLFWLFVVSWWFVGFCWVWVVGLFCGCVVLFCCLLVCCFI